MELSEEADIQKDKGKYIEKTGTEVYRFCKMLTKLIHCHQLYDLKDDEKYHFIRVVLDYTAVDESFDCFVCRYCQCF